MTTPPPGSHVPARCLAKLYEDGPGRTGDLRVSALVEAAKQLGIELGDAQLARLDQLGAALRDGNRRVNLTRITDPSEIETRHFLDSLSAAVPLLDRLRQGEAPRLVDVGSGGGMPGLPPQNAVSRPRGALIETLKQKADLLSSTVSCLGI